MPIEIKFDMPFSLNVEGTFLVKAMGEEFQVTLTTHVEDNPQFPGAESVENLAIVNDNTNILSHTKVIAQYLPSNPAATADPGRYSGEVPNIALSIANALISGVRHTLGNYFLDYLHHAKRLGPVQFSVPAIGESKRFAGMSDPLMGGITIRTPPRTGPEVSEFRRFLAGEIDITVAQDLYLDAKRYLDQRDARMALANLVISFETGLADSLLKIATSRNDAALEAKIAESTLAHLGEQFGKQLLGHSFAESGFWGTRFTDTYTWLRKARNSVLHKARMAVENDGVTKDFADLNELKALFAERDWLMSEVDSAVNRVLAGLPAK